jgi:hypothetical protein
MLAGQPTKSRDGRCEVLSNKSSQSGKPHLGPDSVSIIMLDNPLCYICTFTIRIFCIRGGRRNGRAKHLELQVEL